MEQDRFAPNLFNQNQLSDPREAIIRAGQASARQKFIVLQGPGAEICKYLHDEDRDEQGWTYVDRCQFSKSCQKS